MKFISFIFSIYIFSLSLIPCGDGGDGIVEIIQAIIGLEHAQHADHADHTDHTDHTDHSNDCGDDPCTSLCICSCCSTAIDIPVELYNLNFELTPLPRPVIFSIQHFNSSANHLSIWQPPRFA